MERNPYLLIQISNIKKDSLYTESYMVRPLDCPTFQHDFTDKI